MNKKVIIAIDGLSGSGKGTIAKMLAKEYNLNHLETGLLYRAVGYYTLQSSNTNIKNSKEVIKIAKTIEVDKIKTLSLENEKIAKLAAEVGKINEVRKILTSKQQEYFHKIEKNKNGIILDGRDIGTMVYPNADLKFFLTASLDIRALRRFKQLSSSNTNLTLENVKSSLELRDKSDNYFNNLARNNKDYIIIDSSRLTLKETFMLFTTCINRVLFVD